MLKGWSLIGDALSHSVVPGVAGAYLLGLPYSLGAFISGGLAAAAMLFISQRSALRTDAVIGLIFTGFFGLGLFIASLSPTSVQIDTIVFGNILAITPFDSMVVTPGATAYLLADKFSRLIGISVTIGFLTSVIGAYLSYFLDGATGGIIVLLQTIVFLLAFIAGPKHGLIASRRRATTRLLEQSDEQELA